MLMLFKTIKANHIGLGLFLLYYALQFIYGKLLTLKNLIKI